MTHSTKDGPEYLLTLSDFGVAFSDKIVLSSVNLSVTPKQVVCILGPSGTGKSTLLRTLAGFNDASPNLRIWGNASYAGAPLSSDQRPRLVIQSTRLLMASVLENLIHDLPERNSLSLGQQKSLATRLLTEAGAKGLINNIDIPVVALPLYLQRLIAMIRLSNSGTRLLMLDEPTAGLADGEEELILEYIRIQRERRSILLTLHNQIQAKQVADRCALLAGGTICETGPTHEFFKTPQTRSAQSFVKTGSCSVPSPGTPEEMLSPDSTPPAAVPEEAQNYVSDSFGPRGFMWLIKGKLAGTPMPGVFYDSQYDLSALQRVGITHLVSLMQEQEPPTALYLEYGIQALWCPVPDMGAPAIDDALKICQQVDALLSQENSIAFHCRAGMGRTGTLLATYLIWKGKNALSALDQVRNVEPRWVQSQAQVDFLEQFAQHLASNSNGDPGRLMQDAFEPQNQT